MKFYNILLRIGDIVATTVNMSTDLKHPKITTATPVGKAMKVKAKQTSHLTPNPPRLAKRPREQPRSVVPIREARSPEWSAAVDQGPDGECSPHEVAYSHSDVRLGGRTDRPIDADLRQTAGSRAQLFFKGNKSSLEAYKDETQFSIYEISIVEEESLSLAPSG